MFIARYELAVHSSCITDVHTANACVIRLTAHRRGTLLPDRTRLTVPRRTVSQSANLD